MTKLIFILSLLFITIDTDLLLQYTNEIAIETNGIVIDNYYPETSDEIFVLQYDFNIDMLKLLNTIHSLLLSYNDVECIYPFSKQIDDIEGIYYVAIYNVPNTESLLRVYLKSNNQKLLLLIDFYEN